MSIFMKPYTKEYSVIDPIKPGFDENIIQHDKVVPALRNKILKAVEKISEDINHDVKKVWIIGSTMTYQYTDDSDIDVTLFLERNLEDDEFLELNKIAHEKYNEKLYAGKHPITFYFAKKRFLKYKADGIYDLINEKWIKKSEGLSEDDVEELIKNCSSLEEFNSIFEEYLELQKLLENFEGKEESINEIIKQTIKVSKLFTDLRDLRRKEFEKKPDPELPSAQYRCSNIIYKLLEQYGLGEIAEEVSEFFSSRLEN